MKNQIALAVTLMLAGSAIANAADLNVGVDAGVKTEPVKVEATTDIKAQGQMEAKPAESAPATDATATAPIGTEERTEVKTETSTEMKVDEKTAPAADSAIKTEAAVETSTDSKKMPNVAKLFRKFHADKPEAAAEAKNSTDAEQTAPEKTETRQ